MDSIQTMVRLLSVLVLVIHLSNGQGNLDTVLGNTENSTVTDTSSNDSSILNDTVVTTSEPNTNIKFENSTEISINAPTEKATNISTEIATRISTGNSTDLVTETPVEYPASSVEMPAYNTADECACSHGICSRMVNGSVSCICDRGWEGDFCDEDIEECQTNPDICDEYPNQRCVNTIGWYACVCKPGYKILDSTCKESLWDFNMDDTVNWLEETHLQFPLLPPGMEIPFFGHSSAFIKVSSQGFVTLGHREDDDVINPSVKSAWREYPFYIAPYWSDKTATLLPSVKLHTAHRFDEMSFNGTLLNYANDVINKDEPGPGFEPISAWSVTWMGDANRYYDSLVGPSKAAVQLILATDFQLTYAIITWQNMYSQATNASRVVSAHSAEGGGFKPLHFVSNTRLVVPLFAKGTEPAPSTDLMECAANLKDLKIANISRKIDSLMQCPCLLKDVELSNGYDFQHSVNLSTEDQVCYISSSHQYEMKQVCCYDRANFRIIKNGGLTAPLVIEKSNSLRRARDVCCLASLPLCKYFYDLTHAQCSNTPKTLKIGGGTGYGSLQIYDFMGNIHIFNGWGEYVLLKGKHVELQARTERRDHLNVTYFSALVLKTRFSNSSYQIYVNSAENLEHGWTFETNYDEEMFYVDISPSNGSKVIITTPDIKLEVDKFYGTFLDFHVFVPNQHPEEDEWQGLLADFLTGNEWKLANESMSLFDYNKPVPRTFEEINNHFDYEPQQFPNSSQLEEYIQDIVNARNSSEVTEVCGSDRYFCVQQFDLFGNEGMVALRSKSTEDDFELMKVLEYTPPALDKSTHIAIKPTDIRSNYSFDLAVNTSSGATPNIILTGSMAQYFTISNTTLELHVANMSVLRSLSYPRQLHVYETYGQYPVGDLTLPQIDLCLCQDDAQCMFPLSVEQRRDSVDRHVNESWVYPWIFNVNKMPCACDSPSLAGDFCELEVDVCSNCYNQSSCNASLDVNYCATCPPHMSGDGYHCEEIDECAVDNGGCPGLCTSTDHGPVCSCPDGTRLLENKCEDIDECIEDPNICGNGRYCENIEGSYYCVCSGNRLGEDCTRAPYVYLIKIQLAPTDQQGWESVETFTSLLIDDVVIQRLVKNKVGEDGTIFAWAVEYNHINTRTSRGADRKPEVEVLVQIRSDVQLDPEDIVSALGTGDCVTNCDLGGLLVYNAPVMSQQGACNTSAINECDPLTSVCKQEETGLVHCPCLRGFVKSGDPNTCKDVDECNPFNFLNICNDKDCINTAGSYKCDCGRGLFWDETELQCNLDACALNPCPESSDCVLQEGGATRICSLTNEWIESCSNANDWRVATIVVSSTLGALCFFLIIAAVSLAGKSKKNVDNGGYINSRYTDLPSSKRESSTEMIDRGASDEENVYANLGRGQNGRGKTNDAYVVDRL